MNENDPAGKRSLADIIRSKAFAIWVPGPFGLGIAYLSVNVFHEYGWTLFIGLPLLVSFMSAFCYGFRRERKLLPAYGVAFASVVVVGLLIIVFALDGLICLIMALPLAALIAVLGTILGLTAGRAAKGKASSILPLALIFLLPCLVAFEDSHRPQAPLRAVTTSVEVNAPIDEVWKTVIAFPHIDTPPDGIFRAGIAYPIEATIEGTGVGAIRLCKFCTGDFVEPITTWDENRLLAFSVESSPARKIPSGGVSM
ncbi:MAG: hypothetical protein EOP83_25975, partial [Verrucomicrobiaceae bacterium]